MREGQKEFREATIRRHKSLYKALFCVACNASMIKGSGYNSVSYKGETYIPVHLEAHHLTPYRIAKHATIGVLLCTACHTKAHSGNGVLSEYGQEIKRKHS